MGLLIDGIWHDHWYDTKSSDGKFKRQDSAFRNWVTPDGSSGFPAESGRYHLYVSLACPWAHRTLIFRKLKGLEDAIDVSVVDPFMGEHGWSFQPREGGAPDPDVIADSVNGVTYMHEIYTKAKPDYTGRVTVPVLWDKESKTIVSNESSEIIRMFNSAFNAIAKNDSLDFYSDALQKEIDEINDFVYPNINNGVYKCGFATTQHAYEEAFHALFKSLDELDERLADQRYLVGNTLTEADWRLFTTLVRFDAVYVGHFKCNQRQIADYNHLSGYLRDLYQYPGIAETVNMAHIKRHYYESHGTINPTRVVPVGPALDMDTPHDRDRFS